MQILQDTNKTHSFKRKKYVPVDKIDGKAETISMNACESARKKKPKQEKSQIFANRYVYVPDPRNLLKTSQIGEKTQFSFLNSANGNRILVIDLMMFHLDKKGTYNDRIYWTCASRRKTYKCQCRVTTEFSGNNTKIMNVTALHNHSSHWQTIVGKIERQEFDMGAALLGKTNNEINSKEVSNEAQENGHQVTINTIKR